MLTTTAIVWAAAAVPAPQAAPAEVGRFERFEVAVENGRDYGDPYADVTLDATFAAPDGRRIPFWGFHDGDRTWRLRFLPDEVGIWRYEATFSDGSPGASGSFECVATDLPGMIARDAVNPIWFGYSTGEPELVRGLHVGDRFFASNWPAEDRAAFLDWAGGQGYNLLSIASHYLNRDEGGRGRGWETPALWPLDAAEYREMEAILDDLADRRMLVFPFAGFLGRSADRPGDPAERERFIRYTLARIGPYWNVMLSVGGPEPNLRKHRYLSDEEIDGLGRLIRDLDPFDHLLAVHNRTGAAPFRDSDWSSYVVVQGPKTLDRRALGRALLEWHHPAKPLLAQETLWTGNKNHPDYGIEDLRRNAIVIHMSGANFVYADNAGNSSTGFSGTLDLDDRRQGHHDVVRAVCDLFEDLDVRRLSPRPDLVDRGHCLADPGGRYLVYVEGDEPVSVALEGGRFDAAWINPREPEDRRSIGRTDGSDLAPPDDVDWMLRLDAAAASDLP